MPNSHHSNPRFRISVLVDFDVDTVESAELKLAEEIKKLGLVKQDVLFGRRSKSEAIRDIIEISSQRIMKWNGEGFETVIIPTLTEQESLEELQVQGRVITEDDVWYSEELYKKHLDFIKEQMGRNTIPEYKE